MDTILVANSGSSSVKFEVFGVDQSGELASQLEGKIEGVGTKPQLTAKSAEGKVLVERAYTNEAVSHVPAALHTAGSWLRMNATFILSRWAIASCMGARNSISPFL